MRFIKRYSNRKLYDTVGKKYITLSNIEQLIKQGETVKIIENETGEDITAATLSQIISELTRKSHNFSPSIFVQMIRKGGGTMYDYARKLLQTVGDAAYSLEEGVEKKIRRLIASGEITEEEGKELSLEVAKQRNSYRQKVDQQIEDFVNLMMQKLNIVRNVDVEHLQECLDRLQKCIEHLEKKISDS